MYFLSLYFNNVTTDFTETALTHAFQQSLDILINNYYWAPKCYTIE